MGARVELGLVERRHQGLPVDVAPKERVSPQCEVDHLLSLPVPIWTCLPEMGDRCHDNSGVGRSKRLIAQPQGVQSRGREALDHDVGTGRQLRDAPLAFRRGQVRRNAGLVGGEVEEQPPSIRPFRARTEGAAASEGTPLRRLDHEHAGPHVGQDPGAVGAGHIEAQVEDADTCERSLWHECQAFRLAGPGRRAAGARSCEVTRVPGLPAARQMASCSSRPLRCPGVRPSRSPYTQSLSSE